MKWVLTVIFSGVLLNVFSQQSERLIYGAECKNQMASATHIVAFNTIPSAQTAFRFASAPYDLQKVNGNLKLDRRLIIAGAVLTSTGGIIFGVGLASMFGTRTSENFLAFALLMTGAPLIGVGVPLLGVGFGQRNKWRKRKNQINIQTGILSNGYPGLVLNY